MSLPFLFDSIIIKPSIIMQARSQVEVESIMGQVEKNSTSEVWRDAAGRGIGLSYVDSSGL
jgi:hypothetical protein